MSKRPRCDEWIYKGTRNGLPTRTCSRLAAQWFVWWPDDAEKRSECFYCREHALAAQRDATAARVPYRRVDPIPEDVLAAAVSPEAPHA